MKRLTAICSSILILLAGVLCLLPERIYAAQWRDLTYEIRSGSVTILSCNANANGMNIPEEIDGYPVHRIEEGAFRNCKKLTFISIPNTVSEIGDYAFADCTNLSSVTLPEDLTKIGNYVFQNCMKLRMIILPETVTMIGDYAFYGCDDLVKLPFPDGLVVIGAGAFDSCESLTEVTIPASVTQIGERAFYNCKRLKNFQVDEENAVYAAQENVLYTKDMKILLAYPGGKADTAFLIPTGVTDIGGYAFRNDNLVSITIPGNISVFGEAAFQGCGQLCEIYLQSPEMVSQLTDDAALGGIMNIVQSVMVEATITDVPDYVVTNFAIQRDAVADGISYKVYSKVVHAHTAPEKWECNDAEHWYYCGTCGLRQGVGQHSFGQWVITNGPLDFVVGSRVKVCSVCKMEVTEEIPATGKAPNLEKNTAELEQEKPEPGINIGEIVMILVAAAFACLVVGVAIALTRKKG